jgi:glutathione S-transferase
MQLTLYYAPRTCALVPYVALTEAGARFEVRDFNTQANQHLRPEFLAVNPKHKVPVLLIDGAPLTENVAIQIWIARQFPKAQLLPIDPVAEIQAISLISWVASTIHPHLTPNARPEYYCDTPGSAVGVRRVSARLLREDFAIAERRLADRDWFFEHFTNADTHFYWAFRRATLFGLDLDQFTNCREHMARMEQRPSVQAVLAYERQAQAKFAAEPAPPKTA